jgi:hypothetical protein
LPMAVESDCAMMLAWAKHADHPHHLLPWQTVPQGAALVAIDCHWAVVQSGAGVGVLAAATLVG